MLIHLYSTVRRFIMASVQKPNIVFVLGAPGSGKGTQCQNIVQEFGYVHLSAGDLLRAERNEEKSQYKELIEEYIQTGKIVPVEITCSLIKQAMDKHPGKRFLIDGFPRNQDNLEGWNREMSESVNILFVLFFECSLDICTERCLARGAAGSGRSDDNLESLKKRFVTFKNDTMPIVEYFEKKNLVRRIDASPLPTEVFEEVKKVFQKYE